MVSRTAEVKPWEFVDAFAARDVRKCLLYLGRMDSVSPHALLAMCTTRLRELVCARSMADRRQSPRRGRGAQSARLAREEPCQLGPRLHCRRTAARHHLFA